MLRKLKRRLPIAVTVGAVLYAVLGAVLGYHDANRAVEIVGQAVASFLIGGGG